MESGEDSEIGGRWERRARRHIRRLADAGIVEPRDEGYTDALYAAGIALDLAEASGNAGQVEYARRGWSAALQLLTPPPMTRGPKPGEGVTNDETESEFDRLAAAYYAEHESERDSEFPNASKS
jgi:hypothetical protein